MITIIFIIVIITVIITIYIYIYVCIYYNIIYYELLWLAVDLKREGDSAWPVEHPRWTGPGLCRCSRCCPSSLWIGFRVQG